MQNAGLIVLIVLIVAAAAAGFWFYQRRRTQQLRGRFGPEYERAVREFGNRRAAEAELQRRVHRTTRYAIRDLPPHERDWFAEQWRIEQARFVDEPGEAVTQVHRLVNEVMKARGYPV